MKISKVEAFQVEMGDGTGWMPRSAFVKITAEDGTVGWGEASPMMGGRPALDIMARHIAPALVGQQVFERNVLLGTLFHRLVKLGPEGIATSALAACDIALWDLAGKLLGQPVYALLGGAWRTEFPLYASIGGNAARSVDEVVREVARRVEAESPAAVKIRWDGDRTRLDVDIKGDIAKARAVRELLGPDAVIGFDANNGYSVGGAMRVGRALEELGYAWFEEPVQHYHVAAMGEVAQRLSITVSAGEQTYTLQALKDLIGAGVRMVQPDIVKMGGITGLTECGALAFAHGVELVPHQTQPAVGHFANLHVLAAQMNMTRPVELADMWERGRPVFRNSASPVNGKLVLDDTPGLGIEVDATAFEDRATLIAP
ncbi:mandelate racemase/muconate lactonizing enzyme family protein [uncultured Martelella sp.]|uniref:mandelate racemase/muconate lactonizing enzyme family protein n=1 Tax=uncultured Martelella sp. TaxID=392331 RepID=UPI0029C7B44A|nr:mandelate racemase/muconate lactonizing enzyme family protein [uncultured Martelella sp.]